MRTRIALALAALAAGCAHGTIAARDQHDRVCSGEVCYRIAPLGGDWQLVHQDKAAVGFFSPRIGGVIESNATCNADADVAPLQVLTNHLLIGYTDVRTESQERVPLDQREALHTRVTAKLDGVPMTMELYVMKRNGCIFDLSYAAPPDRFAGGLPDFARFVDHFADVRDKLARGGG